MLPAHPNAVREVNARMETSALLGLVVGTIGVAYLAHGILGKAPRDGAHEGLIVIAILLGACMLMALMLIMWTRSFSPLAFAGSVLYGLLVTASWGVGKPATPTVRGLVTKYLGNRKLVQKSVLVVLLFALGTTFLRWTGNGVADIAEAVRFFFTALGVLAFWGLAWIGVDMLKRLRRRMSEPLLRVAGAALVLAGIACMIAPSVLPLFKTA
jgi:hypothetical protein